MTYTCKTCEKTFDTQFKLDGHYSQKIDTSELMREPSIALQALEAALEDYHNANRHVLDFVDCASGPCKSARSGCATVRRALIGFDLNERLEDYA